MLQELENIQDLHQFLHDCVNRIYIGNTTSAKLGTIESSGLDSARKSIQNYFRQRAIDENCALPADLPDKVSSAVEMVFRIRYEDIVNSLVKEKLIKSGKHLLESFDWKVKWILGSSKSASIREPVCQVDFMFVSLGEDLKPCKHSLNFECDLEQLDKLICVLSNVKNELDGL